MRKILDYGIFLFALTYIVILINMYAVPLVSSYAGEKQISENLGSGKQVSLKRYLCGTDNDAVFTQNPNQSDCRPIKLDDGWQNLYFSEEYAFDYYREGLVRTENEIKVWSRMLFNSPQINQKQNNIKFDELKSLLVFNCPAREYKNPNIVYILNGKELLRTTGDRTEALPDGTVITHFDDKIEQIQPGTFVDALYKQVCFKEQMP
jgi:hypothetical protein